MIRHDSREENTRVDESGEGSFPASDPPSWTLGAARADEPPPPPGSALRPAPIAQVSASMAADTTVLASTRARKRPAPDVLLAGAGALAAGAALGLALLGRERQARGFGHAGAALLLAGIFTRLGRLRSALLSQQ